MPTRNELFHKVCTILVATGRFRMVWIGWRDPLRRTLVPVAHAGDEDEYLRSQAMRAAGSKGEENEHRAYSEIPVRISGDVHGTLNACANYVGSLQDADTALLTEAAAGLSLALEERQAETIADNERLFSDSLIESLPGILYLYNEQGRMLRWNQNFEFVSGYSARELAEMHPLDFFSEKDRPLLRSRIGEVFESGESSVEASFVSKDGTSTPYVFTGKRILFEGTRCLVGMGMDITERKRAVEALSKSEVRYRTTLDNILEGCQLIGFDWTYLYLNDAAAAQNRRPNVELLGRRMPEMWPGIENTNVFALMKRCMEGRIALHDETEFEWPDGTKGWFDVRVQAVPEGIFVLSIDITDRKHAEMALRALNDSLERKVRERTFDLEDARARAESADRIKSAFLATMSHELRTPLNSILGFTGIILQGLPGPLNPEQAKQLGMVQGSARHLLELINDVLDISKIEAGQMAVHPAPFDLRASIDRVTALVRPSAEKKGLALNVVLPTAMELVNSDRRRVDQILLNLLNNAIKFTDGGSVTVTVDISAAVAGAPPESSVIRIRVADTGIGMKSQDLATLFRPFRQIDSGLQRQHEGTGLGLAICRRLTELLGGRIRADSEWCKGSVFTVELPSTMGTPPPIGRTDVSP
jgi:PAS domain S-box-containing protein